jgi:hypothetical protein
MTLRRKNKYPPYKTFITKLSFLRNELNLIRPINVFFEGSEEHLKDCSLNKISQGVYIAGKPMKNG